MYQFDDLKAFGGQGIQIDLIQDNDDFVCTEAWAVVNDGIIVKKFNNPEFPINVTFNEEETPKLVYKNRMNLIVFDEESRPKTCDGTYEFYCEKGVINESSFHSNRTEIKS